MAEFAVFGVAAFVLLGASLVEAARLLPWMTVIVMCNTVLVAVFAGTRMYLRGHEERDDRWPLTSFVAAGALRFGEFWLWGIGMTFVTSPGDLSPTHIAAQAVSDGLHGWQVSAYRGVFAVLRWMVHAPLAFWPHSVRTIPGWFWDKSWIDGVAVLWWHYDLGAAIGVVGVALAFHGMAYGEWMVWEAYHLWIVRDSTRIRRGTMQWMRQRQDDEPKTHVIIQSSHKHDTAGSRGGES